MCAILSLSFFSQPRILFLAITLTFRNIFRSSRCVVPSAMTFATFCVGHLFSRAAQALCCFFITLYCHCPPLRCWLQGTDKYVLRMADDDWDPDLDFPGLDSSAVITDVGVDQFVLCQQVRAVFVLFATAEDGATPWTSSRVPQRVMPHIGSCIFSMRGLAHHCCSKVMYNFAVCICYILAAYLRRRSSRCCTSPSHYTKASTDR